MTDVHTNPERLWSRLMDMAEVGATPAGGSNRQALSDDDKAGRDLFIGWAEGAGCSIELDGVGNLFARRPGADPDALPVVLGSHLDTQPTGGRFDGVYGVLGGLEVVEALNDHAVETRAPVEVAVWTNEEGSRFPVSMMGSAVWAGVLPPDAVRAITDRSGTTVGDELDRLGWAGTAAFGKPLGAYLELHIEQGPILEASGSSIGVVTGVQGIRWFRVTIEGFPAHAGTTPMDRRHDPARPLATILSGLYEVAAAYAPAGAADPGNVLLRAGVVQHGPRSHHLHHRHAPSRRRRAGEPGRRHLRSLVARCRRGPRLRAPGRGHQRLRPGRVRPTRCVQARWRRPRSNAASPTSGSARALAMTPAMWPSRHLRG